MICRSTACTRRRERSTRPRAARVNRGVLEFRELAFVQLPKTAQERAKIAAEVGANLASFQTCVAGDAVAAAVRRDEASAQTLNVSSTPIFYINGRQLVGAQPLDAFVRVIEDELERARAASRPPQQ